MRDSRDWSWPVTVTAISLFMDKVMLEHPHRPQTHVAPTGQTPPAPPALPTLHEDFCKWWAATITWHFSPWWVAPAGQLILGTKLVFRQQDAHVKDHHETVLHAGKELHCPALWEHHQRLTRHPSRVGSLSWPWVTRTIQVFITSALEQESKWSIIKNTTLKCKLSAKVIFWYTRIVY